MELKHLELPLVFVKCRTGKALLQSLFCYIYSPRLCVFASRSVGLRTERVPASSSRRRTKSWSPLTRPASSSTASRTSSSRPPPSPASGERECVLHLNDSSRWAAAPPDSVFPLKESLFRLCVVPVSWWFWINQLNHTGAKRNSLQETASKGFLTFKKRWMCHTHLTGRNSAFRQY